LLYVKRMCLMLDMRILAWTILVVVTGRGIR
ncbi:MAG: sugar transferase, partial [Candidatus Omnitrophica bacterium]|nr:sugar transferase [Candidatus Omnitrophota bacterium]